MLRFKQFILEYLNDAQRDKVNSWLPDKKSGRIYSPKAEQISGHIMPEGQHSIVIPAVAHTMRDVHAHLDKHGYTGHDYTSGTTTDRHGRRVSIGGVLEKTKADQKLINDFANDDRMNAADLENHDIIISRHPHHVAEGSTNKPWTSCAGLTKSGRFCRYGDGAAARKLEDEIREGTHVAYLVPKLKEGEESSNSFPDIQKRIDKAKARVFLKPHHSRAYMPDDHVVLEPEDKVYDKSNQGKNLGLLKTLKKFTGENFKKQPGKLYYKNAKVYDDDSSAGTPKFDTSDESVDALMKSDDPRVKSELRISRDLSADQLHKLIDYHDHPDHDLQGIAELASNKNLNKTHIDKLLGRNIERVNNILIANHKLNKSQIDGLIGNSDYHFSLVNSRKNKLSADHLHKVLDSALEEEKNTINRANARATERGIQQNNEELHNIIRNGAHHYTMRDLARHSSFDSSHFDKLLQSNDPVLHSFAIQDNPQKITNDQAEAISNKWKDTDFSHFNQFYNPKSQADDLLKSRKAREEFRNHAKEYMSNNGGQ